MRLKIGPWYQAPGVVDQHLFVIGDVHGRFDLFYPLHQHGCDLGARVVQIGDTIDRGPESLRALRYALDHTMLPGNHEQMLLSAMRPLNGPPNQGAFQHWISQGGAKVLEELHLDDLSIDEAMEQLETQIGDLLDRLVHLPSFYRIGDYVLVHAGMPAGINRQNQEIFLNKNWQIEPYREEESMLWIRQGFINQHCPFPDGTVVVHGHTIEALPACWPNRIGIDQGAYGRGILTGVELMHDQLRFHQYRQ